MTVSNVTRALHWLLLVLVAVVVAVGAPSPAQAAPPPLTPDPTSLVAAGSQAVYGYDAALNNSEWTFVPSVGGSAEWAPLDGSLATSTGGLAALRPVVFAADSAGTSWADASDLDRTVDVGGNSVSVLGDVSRSGSTVTVDTIALYGTNGDLVNQVGGQALRDAGGSLLREASDSGVNQVIFRGVRAVNSRVRLATP